MPTIDVPNAPADETPSVLLVDDDWHITQGLKDILQDGGYEVEITHSGDDAMAALTRRAFSVMVVDYSLPDMNGVELTRKIRTLYPRLEALLMTGHDRFEMQADDTGSLFAAFLRKPVEVQTVIDLIGEAVRRSGDQKPAPPAPAPAPVTLLSSPLLPSEESIRPQRFSTAALAVSFLLGTGVGWWAQNLSVSLRKNRTASLVSRLKPAFAAALISSESIIPSDLPPPPTITGKKESTGQTPLLSPSDEGFGSRDISSESESH